MKIVIVNGSPRKGNTVSAIEAFVEGAKANNEIEIIDADKLDISGCKGCDACGCTKGCVAQDDTNATVDKLVAADMIVWATPVYWWGMTAQMKLVVDKCYCKGSMMTGKKIATIVTGGAATDNVQYELIKGQFDCIAKRLKWDIVFNKSFSAEAVGELADDAEAIAELKAAGEAIA